MNYQAENVEDYVRQIPEERKEAFNKIMKVLRKNLPKGFEETISYNTVAYVVPKKLYPKGYQVNPDEPLPFIYLASQKNYISLYHMGIYMDKALRDWFVKSYQEEFNKKLDMGKSCIRFKNMNKVPYDLIKDLAGKMTVNEWINLNEESSKR